MTVSSEQSRVQYATDGVATSFPVPFRFLQNRDLRVTLIQDQDGTTHELVLDSDYTLSGANQAAGGTLTTTTPLATGQTLIVERVMSITQETAYQRNDPFPERAHEQALDRLTMIAQQFESWLGTLPGAIPRVLHFPLEFPHRRSTLPLASERARKALIFDENGNVTVGKDNYQDQVESVAESARQAAASASAAHEDRVAVEQIAADFDEVAGAAVERATAQAKEYRDEAQQASAEAQLSAGDAGRYRGQAEKARDDALAAASASGEFVFAKTYAEAISKLPLPNGAVVEVGVDETRSDSRTRYVVDGGALTFAVNLDLLRTALAEPSGSDLMGFQQRGVGSVIRTQRSKNEDTVNVRDYVTAPVDGVSDNQVGIEFAVQSAKLMDEPLLWRSGTYVSTANIPGFWDVDHQGKGVIKRGSDVFAIFPKSNSHIRKLYVSPTGDELNDGLSANFPMTLAKAGRIIADYEGMSRWRVIVAPGTYSGSGANFALGSTSRQKYVEIFGEPVGGHPAVPSSIIDGSSSQAAIFDVSDGNWVVVRDVKATDAMDAFVVNRGILTLTNCHSERVTNAITYQHGAKMTVEGGIYDGLGTTGGYGVRGYYNSTHSILGRDLDSAPLFKNFATGLFITEGCSGHLDFTRVHDCTVGVNFSRMSPGCNTRRMQIYRCGTGVLAINSTWLNNNIDFGIGTPNACAVAIDSRGDSAEFYARSNDAAPARTSRYQGSLAGSFTHGGPETVKWTPLTVRRDQIQAGLDVVKLKMVGSTAGINSSSSSFRFYLGQIYLGGCFVAGNIERFVVELTLFWQSGAAIRSIVERRTEAGSAFDYRAATIPAGASNLPLTVSAETTSTSNIVAVNFCMAETTIGG